MDIQLWEEYAQALHIRFGVTVLEDPMDELMILRQTGELEECLEAFDSLLIPVCLPEEYAIRCLLAVIRGDIVDVVMMHQPKSLLETYALASQHNINLRPARRMNFNFMGPAPRVTGTTPRPLNYANETLRPNATAGILPTPNSQIVTHKYSGRTGSSTKTMTGAKMNEKRRKGICFWCDEKFILGHKCRSRQLHMVTTYVMEETIEE